MGFDRELTHFICGCYYQYWSHDFFNYTKDHQFIDVCGKHTNQAMAMEDQRQKEKQIIVEATDILVKEMDANKIIRNLKAKHVISNKGESQLLQVSENSTRARDVLYLLVKLDRPVLQPLRNALIKAGHSDLLKYLSLETQTPEKNKDSTDGRRNKP